MRRATFSAPTKSGVTTRARRAVAPSRRGREPRAATAPRRETMVRERRGSVDRADDRFDLSIRRLPSARSGTGRRVRVGLVALVLLLVARTAREALRQFRRLPAAPTDPRFLERRAFACPAACDATLDVVLATCDDAAGVRLVRAIVWRPRGRLASERRSSSIIRIGAAAASRPTLDVLAPDFGAAAASRPTLDVLAADCDRVPPRPRAQVGAAPIGCCARWFVYDKCARKTNATRLPNVGREQHTYPRPRRNPPSRRGPRNIHVAAAAPLRHAISATEYPPRRGRGATAARSLGHGISTSWPRRHRSTLSRPRNIHVVAAAPLRHGSRESPKFRQHV